MEAVRSGWIRDKFWRENQQNLLVGVIGMKGKGQALLSWTTARMKLQGLIDQMGEDQQRGESRI